MPEDEHQPQNPEASQPGNDQAALQERKVGVIEPAFSDPSNPKKPKRILYFAAAAILLAFMGAAAWTILRHDNKKLATSTNGQTQRPGSSKIVDSIKTEADLKALSTDQYQAFCVELLAYKYDGPEVKALHDRLGFDNSLSQDIYLGCQLKISGDEYVKKDLSGENDSYYRRDAQKFKATAKSFNFDLYDSTYKASDLTLATRAASSLPGEANNLYFGYATLLNGGFSPYSSNSVIQIYVFDTKAFPQLTSKCGPQLMKIDTAYLHNKDKCESTGQSFLGNDIYKGTSYSTSSYYDVSIKTIRILVTARDESEAIKVIQAMKKVSLDELDFFIKN